MNLYRLRLCLEDVPGQLGGAAATLGAAGCNIIGVDIHSVTAQQRVDELLVEVPDSPADPSVEQILTGMPCDVLDVRPADPHELQDVVTRSLELAARVVQAPPSARHLADVVAELVGAEVACVTGHPAEGVIARALAEDTPAQAQEPVKMIRSAPGPPWLLAVPFGTAPRRVVVLARRLKFTFTETARIQALLRVAAAGGTAESEQLDQTRGVCIRTMEATDLVAYRQMHARCSAESLRRRYFGAVPHHLLATLVEVDGTDTLGVVAVANDQIIGAAHACRTGPTVAEVAFLVEDAHQRRGVGGLLLDHLLADLRGAGVTAIVAATLPDNAPMMRLLRRAATPEIEWADGVVWMTVRLEARRPADV